MTSTHLLRVWIPDRPGALGALASRIGAVGGDVAGIDILVRGAGRVIDELVIAMPSDDPELIELLRCGVGAAARRRSCPRARSRRRGVPGEGASSGCRAGPDRRCQVSRSEHPRIAYGPSVAGLNRRRSGQRSQSLDRSTPRSHCAWEASAAVRSPAGSKRASSAQLSVIAVIEGQNPTASPAR